MKPVDDFPWRQLGILAICRLAEPVAFCSIVAYAFIMVQDIKGDADASFYAGLLVSAFAAAEACTAWFWGDVSDRFGRKPIILVALAGTALSSLIFGFAKHYWLALVARIIGGALNGNVAVMQTMVAEMVTKPEHEPVAYALQPFMWAVGSIAGSALGGFAAQPAKFYPNMFSKDGIFGEYPYLLPNLISVVVIMIAFLLGWLFLEETNPAVKFASGGKEYEPLIGDRRGSIMSTATTQSKIVIVDAPQLNDPSLDLHRVSADMGRTSSESTRPFVRASTDSARPSIMQPANHDSDVVEDAEPEGGEVKTFTKGVIAWTCCLWLLCYHQMAFSSLLPVFLLDNPQAPIQHLDLIGGLGQDLPRVGTILAINSLISLIAQGVIFPAFVSKVGVWKATIFVMTLSPLPYLLPPFVTLLPNPQFGVYIFLALQSLTTTMSYPLVLILLKNACPSPQVLGKINGIAMSGCSGARMLAPPVAGIAYSIIGSAGGWWSSGLMAIVGIIQICFLRRPANTT